MRIRRAIAVAALAVLGLGVVSGIGGWTGDGVALAKGSSGMAGGNGNNGNGAGNGNGGGQPHANIAPVAFHWELVAPVGSAAQLDDASAVKPGFTIDLPGEYEARLVVNDGQAASTPDHVIVSTGNVAPAADAGAGIAAATGDTVALDGTGSADANGDAITYNWWVVEVTGSGLYYCIIED